MIESMTGFGIAKLTKGNMIINVEVRSLNSRYGEIQIRLTREYQNFEKDIRESIQKYIERGKVSINCSIEESGVEKIPVIDEDKIKTYIAYLEKIKLITGINEEITLAHILPVVKEKENELSEEEVAVRKQLLLQATEQALIELRAMRREEGKTLEKDFRKRIQFISDWLIEIEALHKQSFELQKQKLRDQVADLIKEVDKKISSELLETQLLFLSKNMDITEECTRLKSHNQYFLSLLHEEKSQGRKLNFLVQEQQREVNTMSVKSQHAEISKLAVCIKEEIEKIREQLQNIE